MWILQIPGDQEAIKALKEIHVIRNQQESRAFILEFVRTSRLGVTYSSLTLTHHDLGPTPCDGQPGWLVLRS